MWLRVLGFRAQEERCSSGEGIRFRKTGPQLRKRILERSFLLLFFVVCKKNMTLLHAVGWGGLDALLEALSRAFFGITHIQMKGDVWQLL